MISLKSEITKKLLNYYFLNPEDALYINELQRMLKIDKRNLVKKLKELEQEGILKSRIRGNLKLYSINKKYPLYEEYKKITFKTIGFENDLKKLLMAVNGVHMAYIYGSYAQDKMNSYSDIDLLVIGKHNIITLQRLLNKLQQEIKREINIVNMDDDDFKKRIKSNDTFITGLLKDKYIKII